MKAVHVGRKKTCSTFLLRSLLYITNIFWFVELDIKGVDLPSLQPAGGDQFVNTDAGGGHPKLSTYVRLHFGRNLMKMDKFYGYFNKPDNHHSYLDNLR